MFDIFVWGTLVYLIPLLTSIVERPHILYKKIKKLLFINFCDDKNYLQYFFHFWELDSEMTWVLYNVARQR